MSNTNKNPKGDGLLYDIWGTYYPYWNTRRGFFNDNLNRFRRSISDINPFAMRQIPNQQRMGLLFINLFIYLIAFGIRHGNKFYVSDEYPNPTNFSRWFPTHYDPLKESGFTQKSQFSQKQAPQGTFVSITSEPLPRGCQRQVAAYRRCEMVNGEKNCQEEKDNILAICPNFALEGLEEKKKQYLKFEAIQTQQYRSAMEVSDYNKGKTPKDVSTKTWIHGTRHYLRPDTLWADDRQIFYRYVDISQAEINEAKKRNDDRERQAIQRQYVNHNSEVDDHVIHQHHYDFKGAQPRTERPLYP